METRPKNTYLDIYNINVNVELFGETTRRGRGMRTMWGE
jgi:hypothetical protein